MAITAESNLALTEAIEKARKIVQENLLKPTQTVHVVNPTTREELSLKEHLNEIYGHSFASEEEAIEWGKSIVS